MSPEVPLTPSERRHLLELVERRFGIRCSDYGASRLGAAVARLLVTTNSRTPVELMQLLNDRADPSWMQTLVEYLTVGETYFLRDAAQIAAFRERILPDILARRQTERRLRFWSAGCSTGEEVYSLAILLTQASLVEGWDIQLSGTDINRESLRIAREGRYSAWSFRTTPQAVRDRYFEPTDMGWQLNEPIRRMARFGWMNLGADVLTLPTTDLDLIMCRNVTIYFDDTASQRLYRSLIDALAPGGWLLLGPSDPLPADRDRLERVEYGGAVVWRKAAVARPAPEPAVRPVTPTRMPKPRLVTPSRPIVKAQGSADELEAGLLALEAGSVRSAVDWLRRATFRDPGSAVAQFALARAYAESGDRLRAQAALQHSQRLLAALPSDGLVPGSDSMSVDTLRQAVHVYLMGLAA